MVWWWPQLLPRLSRGPHNPGFQTVILPGPPGCALYPSAQVPQTGDSGGCGRDINVGTASCLRIVPCRAAGHARIVVKHHRCSNVKSASTKVRVPPPIASASLTHTHTHAFSLFGAYVIGVLVSAHIRCAFCRGCSRRTGSSRGSALTPATAGASARTSARMAALYAAPP